METGKLAGIRTHTQNKQYPLTITVKQTEREGGRERNIETTSEIGRERDRYRDRETQR